ncbi:thrombospondin-related protein 1 [Plasmodium brasilianum]|uniref:Thrombospondin-related protein 1 n=1 Tax=Plasmodium brasilianum TaxID=5824 RepID=A0ACB9YCJ4_PLABR|nr:thrombospondin-related protein 1 [Plasmodium brasilianum]
MYMPSLLKNFFFFFLISSFICYTAQCYSSTISKKSNSPYVNDGKEKKEIISIIFPHIFSIFYTKCINYDCTEISSFSCKKKKIYAHPSGDTNDDHYIPICSYTNKLKGKDMFLCKLFSGKHINYVDYYKIVLYISYHIITTDICRTNILVQTKLQELHTSGGSCVRGGTKIHSGVLNLLNTASGGLKKRINIKKKEAAKNETIKYVEVNYVEDIFSKVNHSKVNHSKVNHPKVNHSKVNHSKVNHSKVNHPKVNHPKVNHPKVNHSKANHSKVNHSKVNHSKVNHPKSNYAEINYTDEAARDEGAPRSNAVDFPLFFSSSSHNMCEHIYAKREKQFNISNIMKKYISMNIYTNMSNSKKKVENNLRNNLLGIIYDNFYKMFDTSFFAISSNAIFNCGGYVYHKGIYTFFLVHAINNRGRKNRILQGGRNHQHKNVGVKKGKSREENKGNQIDQNAANAADGANGANDEEQVGQKENEGEGFLEKSEMSYMKNNTIQYFKCFLDKARENVDGDSELSRWVDSSSKSCYCSEENAQPCSINDINDSNFVNHLVGNEICDGKQSKNAKDIFIVLSEYNILKCKEENKETEMNKITEENLYNYCKNGLKFWDNKHLYEYMNCDSVKSKEEKNKNICKDRCEDIKLLCNDKNAQFYSFDVCKKYYEMNAFHHFTFVRIFKFFDDNCSYVDTHNKGLVLCKHKNVQCEFSNWSEWTTCTKTCRENNYDSSALKTRKRILLKNFLYAGKSCSLVANDRNNLIDVNFCSELPYCDHNLNNQNKKDFLPPFVIPLKEIEKANTMKELDDDDNDLINENVLNNDTDLLTDCKVTDMYNYENAQRYNEKIRACSCPANETPCYFKDIYNSNKWKNSFDKLCNSNPNINIVTADFITIDCNMLISLKKKEIAINTYLAMTFDCHSTLFQYLFCSKIRNSARTNFIYITVTFILGAIAAIYILFLIFSESEKCKALIPRFNRREKHHSDSSSDEDTENEDEQKLHKEEQPLHKGE